MPLTKEENVATSRIVLELTKVISEGRKASADVEQSMRERRVGTAKTNLQGVNSAFRSLVAHLEDLGKTLSLKDPKETMREELSVRYKGISERLVKARMKKEELEKDKDADPNWLTAARQVVGNYERELGSIREEITAAGLQLAEVMAG